MTPDDRYIITGNPVNLTCAPRDTPNVTYTFHKDSREVQSGTSHTLLLPTVDVSDSGVYRCSALFDGVQIWTSNNVTFVIFDVDGKSVYAFVNVPIIDC